MMGPAERDDLAAERLIRALSRERDAYVVLHEQHGTAHPEWLASGDARVALLAKPVNLLLVAIVNIRLSQDALMQVDYWRSRVSPALSTTELVFPSYLEQLNFFRAGFFLMLMSNIEHGLRAIQPAVVHGLPQYAVQPFKQVYDSLFTAALTAPHAKEHIATFDLLRSLRNTIHNNGVFAPNNGKDASFMLGGKTYTLFAGKRVEYFSWDQIIEYLPFVRSTLAAVLAAELVSSVPSIDDVANHA